MSLNINDPFDVSLIIATLLFVSWFIHALLEFRILCFLGFHRPRTFEIKHYGETIMFRACIRCGHPDGIPEHPGLPVYHSPKIGRGELSVMYGAMGRETHWGEDI